jgi:hypothetical protein
MQQQRGQQQQQLAAGSGQPGHPWLQAAAWPLGDASDLLFSPTGRRQPKRGRAAPQAQLGSPSDASRQQQHLASSKRAKAAAGMTRSAAEAEEHDGQQGSDASFGCGQRLASGFQHTSITTYDADTCDDAASRPSRPASSANPFKRPAAPAAPLGSATLPSAAAGQASPSRTEEGGLSLLPESSAFGMTLLRSSTLDDDAGEPEVRPRCWQQPLHPQGTRSNTLPPAPQVCNKPRALASAHQPCSSEEDDGLEDHRCAPARAGLDDELMMQHALDAARP